MQTAVENTQTLEGVLDKVVFQNPESHWTVARLVPDSGGTPITVVGNLVNLAPGMPLHLRGQWVENRRFGRQFKITTWLPKKPQTVRGIERYLNSASIPGVGTALAKRIVEHFGIDFLDVIDNAPHRLCEVEGVGKARANGIAKAWAELAAINEVMIFLQGHNATGAHALRIYKRYGTDAIEVVRQNPYRLALEVWGIGFATADGIAESLGIARDAPARLEAGLLHVLGELEDHGHCFAPEEYALDRCAELLQVDVDQMPAAVERLVPEGLVVREYLDNIGAALSLGTMRDCETEAAQALAQLVIDDRAKLFDNTDDFVANYQRTNDIELAPEQRRAIAACAQSKCVVITGGPGVGKTTVVRAIVAMLLAEHLRVALAAPTGRAAKRLSESAGLDALTLHRLLEFQPHTATFDRDADRPLDLDVLIVDEASMVDIRLFHGLIVAMPPTARLILVGDVDQLPSVGPGAVLADIIASDCVTVVRLNEIFRQAAQSDIIVNAHAINAGEMPELNAGGSDKQSSDFFFVERPDPVSARDTVLQLVSQRIPQKFGFDPVRDIQVLTPMHRGELGTRALNEVLQAELGDDNAPTLTHGQRQFRVGDKVMQVRNNYDKEIFNGDIGIVQALSSDKEMIVELLDGRHVRVEKGGLDELTHAFACSIHKSQGCEYPCVVITLATQHYMMLQRNLLYTAITRGKELVVVVGASRAVSMAVNNESPSQRWTWLDKRTANAIP